MRKIKLYTFVFAANIEYGGLSKTEFMSSDKDLVLGIQAGDTEAFKKVYRDHFPTVHHFVLQNSGNEENARDVFQEGITAAYFLFKKPGFELTSSLHTLLHSICRNVWLKKLRKESRLQVTDPDQMVLTTEECITEAITQAEKQRLFRQKLSELGADCRQILELFFENRSMKEIASQLKLSEQYVKKRKFLCKEKLVKLIKNDPRFAELKEVNE